MKNRIFSLLLGLLCILWLLPGALADEDTTQEDDSWRSDVSFESPVDYAHPTNILRVYVGYFGGPYYEKETFLVDGDSLSFKTGDGEDIDASLIHDETFSYIDSNDTVTIVPATGIDLTEIINLCGIDEGSIQWIHFLTTDDKVYSATAKELLNRTRYYYPALEDYERLDDFEEIAPELQTTGNVVSTMLALQDRWETDGKVSHAMRLLFGQSGPTEQKSQMSGKWVHTVVVQLGGSPSLDMELDLSQKVGSEYRVTVNIAARNEDGRLTNVNGKVASEIASELKIESSNRNALDITDTQLNDDGSITVTVQAGTGTAELSINAGNYDGTVDLPSAILQADNGSLQVISTSGSVTVTENEQTSPNGSEETSDGENKDVAEPTSQSDDTSAESADAQESMPDITSNGDADNALTEGIVPETENAEKVNSILVHKITIDSSEGSVQNWRETDMAEDAVALGKEDTKDYMPAIGIFSICVVILGMAIHGINYRKETVQRNDSEGEEK